MVFLIIYCSDNMYIYNKPCDLYNDFTDMYF